jgi:hypothetical protein
MAGEMSIKEGLNPLPAICSFKSSPVEYHRRAPPQFNYSKGWNHMKSLKNWSRITNILVFIAGFISYVGADGLKGVIPAEYQYLIPFIVMAAGYVLVQLSEDARVSRAEELVRGDADVQKSKRL